MLVDMLDWNIDIRWQRLLMDKWNMTWDSELSSVTFEELLSDLKWLKVWPEFYAYYDSLLQLTLDFWNSNKTKFDELWFVELMSRIINPNVTKDEIEKMKTFAEDLSKWVIQSTDSLPEPQLDLLLKSFQYMDWFISPMSKRYKWWLSTFWLWITKSDLEKSKWSVMTGFSDTENLLNNYYPMIWSKKDVYDYIKDKYWDIFLSWLGNIG